MSATQPAFWIELAILTSMFGAFWVSRLRDPFRAWRWGILFTGAALALSLIGCLAFYFPSSVPSVASIQSRFLDRPVFVIDELNAPLASMAALMHCLTALATARTKMRRFSMSWSLTSEAIRLALFSAGEPRLVIALLIAGVVPGYVELRNRNRSTRVYLLHMGLFSGLILLGWAGVHYSGPNSSLAAWSSAALLAAILLRCGVIPFHCWVTDWFENASLGNALLFATPLTSVYAALRLAYPIAPDWVLGSIGAFSLATAAYSAGMALIQIETRRFLAYLFLSHASLVLVGLELHTTASLTGALLLWISAALSLTGLGLTLRALEARFGRMSLAGFRGLYEHAPELAVCFLLTGLASVGFPGALGFVATEMLADGAVQADMAAGVIVALTAACNGIAVLRAYFRLFTGARHASSIPLMITRRERVAVLTISALIIGGGLYPQPGVTSRYRAAQELLQSRQGQTLQEADRSFDINSDSDGVSHNARDGSSVSRRNNAAFGEGEVPADIAQQELRPPAP